VTTETEQDDTYFKLWAGVWGSVWRVRTIGFKLGLRNIRDGTSETGHRVFSVSSVDDECMGSMEGMNLLCLQTSTALQHRATGAVDEVTVSGLNSVLECRVYVESDLGVF